MIPATSFADRRVAVFGLGASGIATARALSAGGAVVTAWDDNANAVQKAQSAGIRTDDLRGIPMEGFAALVLAPGVPLTHPKPHWSVERAYQAGIQVIGDIEIFCRERRRRAPKSPFIAVTGTNGKSTTVALIAHLLRTAGREVQLGGNLGTPILALEPPDPDVIHVIECSSFQIDLAPSLDPTIGVLLNLAEDHIDRHGSFARYAAIKQRLVARAELAVVGTDDEASRLIAGLLQKNDVSVRPISAQQRVTRGVYAAGEAIRSTIDGTDRTIASLAGIGTLRGSHNAQNAAAAVAVTLSFGLDRGQLVKGLQSFPGLPHRMEEVGRRDKVLFVNDSKATNADAAQRALACFDRIYWIAGGRAKSDGIASLEPFFPRVVQAYLIGEAADDFGETLGDKVQHSDCRTLDAALKTAADDAAKDPSTQSVVLLSPACTSYDQFRNFEDRGNKFRELVRGLDGIEPKGEAA